MFLEIVVISVIIGLLRGGSLSNLARLEIKFAPFIFIAFLIQFAIDFMGAKYPWGGYPYFHLASYFLLIYALYRNHELPGMKLFLAGTVLNFSAIVLNGGAMPVRGDILPQNVIDSFAAGLGGTHGLLTETTRVQYLADILFVPVPYEPQILSLGDLVIDAGILVVLISALKRSPEA